MQDTMYFMLSIVCTILNESVRSVTILCVRRAKLGQIQGGLQRAIQDSTKGGGIAIICYFLHVKNRTY